jgi:hypothetical protein
MPKGPYNKRKNQEQKIAPSNLTVLGSPPLSFLLPPTLHRDSYLPAPFSFHLLGGQFHTRQVLV